MPVEGLGGYSQDARLYNGNKYLTKLFNDILLTKGEFIMSEENKVEPKREVGIASQELYNQALRTETIYMTPTIFQQMSIMSKKFFESKALPKYVLNEAQAVVIMQSGYEMGMQPMESFKSLYILNGNITIWGAAVTRRITLHGWEIDYQEKDNECTAILTKGRKKLQETVTFEEFEKSGSTKAGDGSIKANWAEGINRRTKLRYGALSLVIKTRIPEVMGVASEIKEVAEDWNIPEEKTGNTIISQIVAGSDKPVPPIADFLKSAKLAKKVVEEKVPKVKEEKIKLHQTDLDEQIEQAEGGSPFVVTKIDVSNAKASGGSGAGDNAGSGATPEEIRKAESAIVEGETK